MPIDDLPPLTPDPVIEVDKRDVDKSLYRENLKLTVQERFEIPMWLQRFAGLIERQRRPRDVDSRRASG